jgi:L-lactate dehydrogenase (cytochrome)
VARQFDPSLTWADIEWFRHEWRGRVVLKGLQTVEDARIALEHGVDAVALSNHGGRQLDGAPVPIELLGQVIDAIDGRMEIYCDGGVRRGSDLVKALALGARGVMVGRAYLYGLGAAGERGVDHVIRLLGDDVERVMALLGTTSIGDITSDHVRWVR